MRIPLSTLDITDREVRYVTEAVRSGWISSSGQYCKMAEDAWANYCGNRYCTLVCNGTAGLHVSLMAFDLKPGDEVIVPGMTFVSPAAVVKRMGGLPILADVEETTWCIDPEEIRRLTTPKTRGVIAVDLLGHPFDYDPVKAVCDELNLFLIEDAAEAHGSTYKGHRTGTLGDLATFSFFANKTLGCGEGGAVLTADPQLFDKVVLLKNHGMRPSRPYWHEFVGDNFRMTNLAAAVLFGQIERVDELCAGRNRVSQRYRQLLAGIPGIEMRPSASWAELVTWIDVLRVLPGAKIGRNELVAALRAEGIDARPLWTPLVELPPFCGESARRAITTPRSRNLLGQLLWLPTSSNMCEEDISFVADCVKRCL